MTDIGSLVKILIIDGLQGLDDCGQIDHFTVEHVIIKADLSESSVVLQLDV